MKTYYIQNNIGKAKYCLNYHNGVKTNKDGSRFYDLEIFRNKKLLNNRVYQLLMDGYIPE